MWGDAADEYAHYCRHVAGLIEQHAERPAGTLLDIGCGGGKNVFNLKERFSVTGVDLSLAMLAQARDLNPASTFVHGDMRTLRVLFNQACDVTAIVRVLIGGIAPHWPQPCQVRVQATGSIHYSSSAERAR